MAKKATEKEDLSSKSYEELEKMAEQIMAELSKVGIGLDQSSKLYRQGKAVLKEMEDRLEKLTKEVSDTISHD